MRVKWLRYDVEALEDTHIYYPSCLAISSSSVRMIVPRVLFDPSCLVLCVWFYFEVWSCSPLPVNHLGLVSCAALD